MGFRALKEKIADAWIAGQPVISVLFAVLFAVIFEPLAGVVFLGFKIISDAAFMMILARRPTPHDPEADTRRAEEACADNERFAWATRVCREIQQQLEVSGQVTLMPFEGMRSNASAIRYTPTYAVMELSRDLVNFDDDVVRGVIAHEMAHLQHTKRFSNRVIAEDARMMVVYAVVGVLLYAGVPPLLSGAVGVLGLLGAVIWSADVSRREEQRADLVAYQLVGDPFATALLATSAEPHPRWWQLGTLLWTHPPLEKRVAYLREAGADISLYRVNPRQSGHG